jgi:intraflagellar transport protein 46
MKSEGDASSEGEEHEESYEHIEGAYNPKDYQSLNVPTEVRDLFQYIERYKPQEVELDTPLKCFIPEFLPAIGELDPFIKVVTVLYVLSRSFLICSLCLGSSSR